MRDYELVLLLDPDLTSDGRKKLLDKIKKVIQDQKGKVLKETDWASKKLTYPIGKKNRANYFYWQVQMPASGPEKFESKLRLETSLLRYLLVRSEEVFSRKPSTKTPVTKAKGKSTIKKKKGEVKGKKAEKS